ncbi:hypothetical protein [Enterocloster bolteae]|uniref:hypothetical protein n=1 Tax=Enterocloster bolteae TaxID=208479 RepID=UPI00210CE9B2|nr:hypothetical protein [Enterocloster bolteae]MCQ5140953.1 hypothetical protein [Enterocloster bolteae]
MNIYQLHYTRLGKQGSGAGWQITGTAKGTPQLVINAFYKIASNLVLAGAGNSMPAQALDIHIEDRYVYISHINYSSRNLTDQTDIRGVSFVHGLVMRTDDYMELCRQPDRVMGIEDSFFDRDYEGKKDLPVLHTLPCASMDMTGILKEYGMDQTRYSEMMKCVYAALYSVNGSLCIKAGGIKGEQLKTLCRKMTYLIYQGLPYVLRLKLSIFSGYRPGVTICFSEKVENRESFYDLDTGEYRCAPLPEYEIVSACTNLFLTKDERSGLYGKINEFAEVTYGGSYEIIKLHHMEIAYQAVHRNVPEEKLNEYMKDAAGVKAYKYDLLDPYYAYLLDLYMKYGMELPSADIYRKIQKRYAESNCNELKQAFCYYYAWKLCTPGNNKAYVTMYQLQMSKPDEFRYMCEYLEEQRPQFLDAYYEDYYLEHYADSLERLEELCARPEEFSGEVRAKLLEITSRLFAIDIARQKDNKQRFLLCGKYADVHAGFAGMGTEGEADFQDMLNNGYWRYFDVRQFSYSEIDEYVLMGAGTDKNTEIPGMVRRLLEARKCLLEGRNLAFFYHALLSDSLIEDAVTRDGLIRQLREEAQGMQNLSLDSRLLLNYTNEDGFDLDNLAQDLREYGPPDVLGREWVRDNIPHSTVLERESKMEELFKRQLKDKMKERTVKSEQWKAVYSHYFPRMTSREQSFYMMDYAQKCLLFLGITMTYAVSCRYLYLVQKRYGAMASCIGILACIAGMLLNMIWGETNSVELLVQRKIGPVVWTIIYILLSAVLLGAAVMADTDWMYIVLGAALGIILLGRLTLMVFTLYE